MIEIKEVLLDSERTDRNAFLKQFNMTCDNDVTYSVLAYDQETIIGTASLANNVMKCFLVDPNYQDNQIMTKLFHHLVKVLDAKNVHHYFVYTPNDNQKIFETLHMKTLVKTMNTTLLEGGDTIDHVLTNLKHDYNVSDEEHAAIIMNANPMTLGHLHLVETAADEHDHVLVFVVSEDVSKFPFEDRFSLIKKATKHMDNVTVLPTLDYLVSKITFPKYFLKEDQLIKDEQTLIDVLVYKEYFVPIFNITCRYLGEEPYSYNTKKYNTVLKDHLGNHIKIIKRKELFNHPISASFVRKLIRANKLDKVKPYVPDVTFEYLKSDQGQKVINAIQNSEWSRH
ncbi:MAG: GNAT family N-acetyltransferase [Candidatus Izemoplasma sp.]|nr:GNAT family N-acetyltransferase [Candidatus Izemoplasma sp.]